MGYNEQKRKMKKLLLAIAIIMGFLASANAQQDKARVPGDENNYVFASISDDSQTSSSIKFYNNSTKSIKVCVSVLNEQNFEVGRDCYEISGRANGQMERLSKMRACENLTCEAKRIRITSVE